MQYRRSGRVGHGCWVALAAGLGLVSSPAASLEREYRITTWETDDGLPENSATAMVQAADGFLWFGTFNGLVRFDGVRFEVFNPRNTPELPGASIVNLHLHRSGQLWISTSRGLATLTGGQWKRRGQNTSWTNRIVRTFAENAAGVLCATSFDGAVCRIVGEEIIELPPPTVARGQLGHVDPAGKIWAVSAEFFGHWDGLRWVPAEAAASVTNTFRFSTTARDGALWVLQESRLLKCAEGRIIQSVALQGSAANVWDLFEDEEGLLWASSYQDGLFRIARNGAVEHFTKADGLSYDTLRFVFQDRERNLWVGSSGGGLVRLRPRTFHTFGTETSLPARVVKSVWEEAPGSMLLGTYGRGVARVDEAGNIAMVPATGGAGAYVQCVLVDQQRRTWIGYFGQADSARGLMMVEGGQTRIIPPAQAGGVSIAALYEDSARRIWIGGSESVVRFERGEFRRLGNGGRRVRRDGPLFRGESGGRQPLGGEQAGSVPARRGAVSSSPRSQRQAG